MAAAPHFGFPFRFSTAAASRAVVQVEQESPEDLQACVAAILSYPAGFRTDLPDFGVPEQAFVQGGPDMAELRSAIAAYEPRASVDLDLTDEFLTNALAQVQVGVSPLAGG